MSDFENQVAADEAKRNAPVWTEHNSAIDFTSALAHDGVRALLDMPGAMTRAHLRSDLANRFTILPQTSGEAKDAIDDAARMLGTATGGKTVDEAAITKALDGKSAEQRAQILAAYQQSSGHTLESALGDRSTVRKGLADQSNMLTAAQYEDVVKLMADVELGRTDLVLETHGMNTVGKRDALRGDLADILQTDSGRALLGGLAHRKDDHHTFINGSRAPDNGTATPLQDQAPSISTTEYAAGQNVHHDQADLRSDVVLYHELVHSMDQLDNTIDRSPITKGNPEDVKGKIHRSEYRAAGLGDYSNARLSERRYTDERRQIGKRNFGERATGVADDDLKARTRYTDLTGVAHYAD